MRAVIQRVTKAHVDVNDQTVGHIDQGMVVLLGVSQKDDDKDAKWLAEKITKLRIFTDDQGKMNLTIKEVGGRLLVVSQFTLYGSCRKGSRPSFTEAARPDQAVRLYRLFCEELKVNQIEVETGVFQAHMQVHLINDGPVTLILDSPEEV